MNVSRSNKELFKRLFVRTIVLLVLVVSFAYLLPNLIHLLFPIILAYIVAAMINPIVNLANRGLNKIKLNSAFTRNLLSLFFTLIILLFIGFVFYTTFSIALREIISFATAVQDNWTSIVLFFEDIDTWFELQSISLSPIALDLLDSLTINILASIENLNENLLDFALSSSSWVIARAGTLTLNLVTFFLALYFIITDFNQLEPFVSNRLDKGLLNSLNLLKNTALAGIFGYIKTQAFIAIFAFVFMFVALTLYRQPYTLVISVGLAIIDLIPLIGTIAVLLSWGAIEIIGGNVNQGVFLIALGIIYFIIRRIIEPKIMGTQTGLHPLLALIGIYVGLQYSGLWGALLGPLVMVVIVGVLRSGLLDNTFADIKELYYKIMTLLSRNYN